MSQYDPKDNAHGVGPDELLKYYDPAYPNMPSATDVVMLQQMAEQRDWRKCREAYRGPDGARHLDEEIYRGIGGAMLHFQEYVRKYPPQRPVDPLERGSFSYHFDPLEHAIRSIHAMVLQELDLYLEARESQIRYEMEVRHDIPNEKT